MKRFGRDFELIVGVGSGRAVTVVPPMRVVFSVDKSVAGGLNKATIRIYNLKDSNRQALQKDAEGDTRTIPVQLRIGYDGELGMVFKGTVFRGKNYREGPEMVTELECLDGGAQVLPTYVNQTVRGLDTAVQAVRNAAGLEQGKITAQPAIVRPRVLVGSVSRLLDELTEESWYIDDEQLFVLNENEVRSKFVPIVNSATGLLNTPTRQMSKITFDTLMNPALRIGGLCELVSTTAPNFNGIYKINEMSYSGDNFGADWSQSCSGFRISDYVVVK